MVDAREAESPSAGPEAGPPTPDLPIPPWPWRHDDGSRSRELPARRHASIDDDDEKEDADTNTRERILSKGDAPNTDESSKTNIAPRTRSQDADNGSRHSQHDQVGNQEGNKQDSQHQEPVQEQQGSDDDDIEDVEEAEEEEEEEMREAQRAARPSTAAIGVRQRDTEVPSIDQDALNRVHRLEKMAHMIATNEPHMDSVTGRNELYAQATAESRVSQEATATPGTVAAPAPPPLQPPMPDGQCTPQDEGKAGAPVAVSLPMRGLTAPLPSGAPGTGDGVVDSPLAHPISEGLVTMAPEDISFPAECGWFARYGQPFAWLHAAAPAWVQVGPARLMGACAGSSLHMATLGDAFILCAAGAALLYAVVTVMGAYQRLVSVVATRMLRSLEVICCIGVDLFKNRCTSSRCAD